MRLHRPLLALPDPREDASFADAQLLAAQRLLARGDRLVVPAPLQWAEGESRPSRRACPPGWQPLWHELSERALQQTADSGFRAGRSARERELCSWLTPLLGAALRQDAPEPFCGLIEALGRRIEGSGFRVTEIGLAPGVDGDRVMFPAASDITPQLCRLHGYLRHHGGAHPLGTAVVAMVALTNVHLFPDGNGRASRMLFQALLRWSGGLQGDYVPLYEMFWQCGCGYELRVREAEITGHWRPLLAFIGRLLCLAGQPAEPQARGVVLAVPTC